MPSTLAFFLSTGLQSLLVMKWHCLPLWVWSEALINSDPSPQYQQRQMPGRGMSYLSIWRRKSVNFKSHHLDCSISLYLTNSSSV